MTWSVTVSSEGGEGNYLDFMESFGGFTSAQNARTFAEHLAEWGREQWKPLSEPRRRNRPCAACKNGFPIEESQCPTCGRVR